MATTKDNYNYAIGRRKTARATLRLYPAAGENMVNDKALEAVYADASDQASLMRPFKVAGLDPKDFHFTIKSAGGGVKSQLGAMQLALARALVMLDPEHKKALKTVGLLTRDPRMVERKKPGLHKARKAEQYSKR